ncbi:MAG: SdiA-regulated domain-containing protein [Chitinispirillaceae bacterium]|nr:SdiA-regulated domain-containing protein [Chitinispirillaceae bacterium]
MVHRMLPYIVALTDILSMVNAADAESIAAALSSYQRTLSVTSVAGVTASSFSGIALRQPGNALFAVDNGNANVYELTATGSVVRTLPTSGVTDLEGIGHYRDDLFFVAEEGGSNILRVTIPKTGAGSLDWSAAAALNFANNWANTGLEGVSFRPANNTLYAVKEIDPPRLYRITLDDTGSFLTSYANDPFNIESKSGDAADIFALNDGNFIIVNQEQRRLEGYGPAGESLSTLSLEMNKPEGIAVDTADGTLYVVGEPREFCVYKKITGGIRAPAWETDGYSFSALPAGMPGHPLTLTVSVPRRSSVTIDCILLDGADFRVFEGMLDRGSRVLRPVMPEAAAGIRLLRFSTGFYQRVIACTLPQPRM